MGNVGAVITLSRRRDRWHGDGGPWSRSAGHDGALIPLGGTVCRKEVTCPEGGALIGGEGARLVGGTAGGIIMVISIELIFLSYLYIIIIIIY